MKISRNRPIKNVSEVNASKKSADSALDHIMSAIKELGTLSSVDASYKEDIANLSVVLFDIKSRQK